MASFSRPPATFTSPSTGVSWKGGGGTPGSGHGFSVGALSPPPAATPPVTAVLRSRDARMAADLGFDDMGVVDDDDDEDEVGEEGAEDGVGGAVGRGDDEAGSDGGAHAIPRQQPGGGGAANHSGTIVRATGVHMTAAAPPPIPPASAVGRGGSGGGVDGGCGCGASTRLPALIQTVGMMKTLAAKTLKEKDDALAQLAARVKSASTSTPPDALLGEVMAWLAGAATKQVARSSEVTATLAKVAAQATHGGGGSNAAGATPPAAEVGAVPGGGEAPVGAPPAHQAGGVDAAAHEAVCREAESLRHSVAKERARVDALKAQVMSMTANSADSKAAMDAVCRERDGLRRDVTRWKADADERGGRVAELQAALEEANVALAALRAQQDARPDAAIAQPAAEEVARLRAEVDRLHGELDAAASHHGRAVAALQAQYDASAAECQALKQAATARGAQVAELEGVVAQLRATGAAAEATSSSTVAELTAALATARADAAGRIQALQDELGATQARMAANADAMTAAHAAAAAAAEGALAAATQRATELAGQVTTLHERLAAAAAEAERSVAAATAEANRVAALAADRMRLEHEQRVEALTRQQKAAEVEAAAAAQRARSVSSRLRPGLEAATSQLAAIRAGQDALRHQSTTASASVAAMLDDMNDRFTATLHAYSEAFAGMMARYRRELAERRRLHNLVQELRGNIRVYCRVRPTLPFELESGGAACVSFPEVGEIMVTNGKRQTKTWEFDQVFMPHVTNDDVFKETEPLVVSAMDGYNVCVFAYGQTGSGKTFTMEGNELSRGINYRSLETLFLLRDGKRAEMRYDLAVAMLEIYNESIQDMLASRGGAADPPTKLTVRESPGTGVFVPDLTLKPVGSLEEVLALMRQGYKNRTTFATNMNERSSRSHCMLSVYITGTHVVTGQVLKGKLHLIDLAGSERVSKSGVTGDRLREAQNINKSLSALGDVIQARAEKRGHVPYRNSTLTFLLSDSLAGDSKTLMFVNLSPIAANAEETFCSLNFAARVRSVELGKASKHVVGGTSGTRSGAGAVARLASTPSPAPEGADEGASGDGGDDWGLMDDGVSVGDDASGVGSVEGVEAPSPPAFFPPTPKSGAGGTPVPASGGKLPAPLLAGIGRSTPGTPGTKGGGAATPIPAGGLASPSGKPPTAPLPSGPAAAGSAARRMLAAAGKK